MPHRMYYAANRLYETTDAGNPGERARICRGQSRAAGERRRLYLKQAETQRGAIYAASASALREGLIWAGTDDGLIWNDARTAPRRTRQRRLTTAWANVTPPALTPWSKVTQIEASHFEAQVAYASVSRFRLDDLKPYIYRTRDGGQSWQLIVDGLPADAPVNTVREDPERRGLLFAGTENAVWMSLDDGDHWSSLQLNLPHTSMRDLAVHGQDLILATHGRSLWILDDIGPLRQVDETLLRREAALLKPAPAIRRAARHQYRHPCSSR